MQPVALNKGSDIVKIIQRIIILFLLSFVISQNCFAANFSDTSGHWAEEAINTWSEKGIINGYDEKFNPDECLTRAELATILSNLLGLNNKAENIYGDITGNEWYANAILKCTAAGIMSGDGVNANSTQNITREAAMVMLARALNVEESHNIQKQFLDYSSVSPWAKNYVNAMINNGYVNGIGNGMLAPTGNITRAAIVTILDNAIKMYINYEGEYIIGNDIEGIVVLKGNGIKVITDNKRLAFIISDEYSYESVSSDRQNSVTVNGGHSFSGGGGSISNNEAYTVTFIDKPGSVYEVKKVQKESSVKISGIPTLSGSVFTGWDTDLRSINSNISINAKWTDVSETDNVIAAPSCYASAGDTTTIPFKLCGKVNLCGMDIAVSFDNHLLEFLEYKNEDDDVIVNYNADTGIIHLNLTSSKNISGEIDLCELCFKVKATEISDSKLTISAKEIVAFDDNNDFIKPSFKLIEPNLYLQDI